MHVKSLGVDYKIGRGFRLVIISVLGVTSLISNVLSQTTESLNHGMRFRMGVLDNGLSYYIVKNNLPLDKVEFRFVNRVGSFSEGRDEKGLSHLVEHLGFRSTKHFPDGMKEYFEAHGLINGSDFGGNTSITTHYKLTIPSKDTNLLNAAFWAVHDWADGVLFLPSDIAQEKAAVINELSSAMDSAFHAQVAPEYLLLDRNPLYIRTSDSIDSRNTAAVNAATLIKFYKKYYKPERQAIIVVGDLDIDEIQRRIESEFSGRGRRSEPAVDSIYQLHDVKLSRGNKVLVLNHGARDPSTQVIIYKKRKNEGARDRIARCRTRIIDEIYRELLRNRFDKIKISNSRISIISKIERRSIHELAGIDALRTDIRVEDYRGVKEGIELAIKELRRIERWGFLENELDHAKAKVKYSLQRNSSLRSSLIGAKIIGAFAASDVPFLDENGCIDQLDGVCLDEINRIFEDWSGVENNFDVVISLPSETAVRKFSDHLVFSWIKSAREAKMVPYVEPSNQQLAEPNVDLKNEEYLVKSSLRDGVVHVILNNGVNVYIESMGSLGDAHEPWNEVAVRGAGKVPSVFNKQVKPGMATGLARVVSLSGLSTLNYINFSDWKREKNGLGYFDVSPYINSDEVGFIGGCTLNNVGELMKSIYYYYSEPRIDKKAFEAWKDEKAQEEREKMVPRSILEDSIQVIMGGGKGTRRYDDIAYENVLEVYKSYFQNAKDLNFVVTGYFEVDEIIPIVSRYLGALKITNHRKIDSASDSKAYTSKGAGRELARLGFNRRIAIGHDSTQNGSVRIIFPIQEFDNKQHLVLKVLNELMTISLYARLREREGGVYGAWSSLIFGAKDQQPYFEIGFDAKFRDVDRLVAAAIDEVTNSLMCNIRESDFSKALSAVEKRLRKSSTSSQERATVVINCVTDGVAIPDRRFKEDTLRSLTVSDIQAALRKALSEDEYFVFTLF